MNLLKSRKEAMFQFGGEFYGAVGVEDWRLWGQTGKYRERRSPVDFFLGVGPSGWDGFIVDVLWRRLFEGSEASRFMATEGLKAGRTVAVLEGLFASLPVS